MRTLQITLKGITPLIMHSCRTVNPLHPLKKELAKYTGKRKKTDDDFEMISHLEWLASAYYNEDVQRPIENWLDDGMYLYIPTENIEKTIINGAKMHKRGKDIERFVAIPGLEVPVDIEDARPLREIWKDLRFRDVRQMVVNRARVTRTRARFDRWKTSEFEMLYDETKIDIEGILQAIENAGKYVGLCDSRPKYGQFTAIINELD